MVLLSIPAVQRLHRRRRTAVPLAILAASLAVRFGPVQLPTVEPHDIRPHDIVWIFALGWLAAEARSNRSRVLLSAVIVLAVPGYFGEPAREAFLITGLLLVLWVPRIRLLRPAAQVAGSVAAASLYIYLSHWQVFPPCASAHGPVVALVGSVVAGIALWTLVGWASRLVRRWRQAEGAIATAGATGSLSAPSAV